MGQRHPTQRHRKRQPGDGGRQFSDDDDAYKTSAMPVALPPIAPVVDRAAGRTKMDRVDVHSDSSCAHPHSSSTRPVANDPVVSFGAASPAAAEGVAAPIKAPAPPPHKTKPVRPHETNSINPRNPTPVNPHDLRGVNRHWRVPPVTSDTQLPPIVQMRKVHAPRKGILPPLEFSSEPTTPSSPPPPPAPPNEAKNFTEAEIKDMLATDPNRVVVIIKKNVYDVTTFVEAHPGGPSVLRHNRGKDITDTFAMMHGPQVAGRLPEFLLGRLVTEAEERSPRATAAAATAKDEPAASSLLSLDSIRQMLQNDPQRLILVMFGDAYDVTPMRNAHPGGLRILLNHNGKECGDIFMRVHGLHAKKQAHQYLMGRIAEAGDAPSPLLRFAEPQASAKSKDGVPAESAMQSTRILEKEMMNDAGTLQCFTFSCPLRLRLTPAGHVKIYSDVERDEWRYYTPFKSEVASFKICVKLHPHGRTSKYLFDQPEGKELFYEGPFPPAWELRMDAYVRTVKLERRHILLLAGGTGIAPMYAIAASELEKQSTSVTLVCSVRTPDDLILVDEINELATRYVGPLPGQPHQLRVALIFSRLPKNLSQPPSPLRYTKLVRCGTHITVDFLKALELPPAQAAVLSGPPAFNDTLADVVLKAGICPAEGVHTL
ncbi:putative nitrate reductase [Leptomonas pyrrhocoris]|uniref:cytochrome-b5 reductase n=1 Tax=Leptomonas pyrrhocoris TaxID=157538 RepID=A0A0N0DXP3_LEPPY|nr:putative nitrate reductase [Leptomonas pyrrhocoris]KPA83042.1 putative nitrate reductase [Leptomonas pyrrhocoris]|eukprot:XP_015661481.1 putative nitrate reductase [Leptomonas pyrrhocoris]